MEPTQAYRQGKEAFYMFKKNQNPYIKNTPQFNDWNKGYDDEAKSKINIKSANKKK